MQKTRRQTAIRLLSAALFVHSTIACADGFSGYSPVPLANPVFDAAEVAVKLVSITNWLNHNHTTLTQHQQKLVREDLYTVMASHIAHRHADGQPIYPAADDIVINQVFSWAGRLGVFGGDQIFANLPATGAVAESRADSPIGRFSSENHRNHLHLSSESKTWTATFPYYFMLGDLQTFTSRAGHRTELATISTGSAQDDSKLGYSQATIMLAYALNSTDQNFEAFWLNALNIPASATAKPVGESALHSRGALNPDTGIHSEVVFRDIDPGSLAIMYLGRDGTYQTNRPHFIEFVDKLVIH